ncbi:MAG TPA: hypothetical protein VLC52_13840 [Anaerolineae bacterium]|nr:hypothetical protein [Anaerolineae bacterium]
MHTKDQFLTWVEQNVERALENLTGTEMVVFVMGDNVAIKAEPKPCEFKPLAGAQIPLDADLCDMPHEAERMAARIDLRLQEPAFKAALRAADLNNVGCLSMWRPNPDRKQAAAQFKEATKGELGYDDLPPASKKIVKDNLDLLQAVPDEDVIIRPLVALERDLGKAEVDRIRAGLVEGLRCEIIE